jgi:uncharacterized membrane protein
MKCRLNNNEYCDEDFQIEFKTISEMKDLINSLNSMYRYMKMLQEDGDELPELTYRIDNHKDKKNEKLE